MGLEQHAEAWAELRARLPLEPFEIPLVPPSIPGIRLWRVLREIIRAAGGRVQIGESVARIHVEDGRVTAVEMEAAARSQVIRTEALVLATGGIAGGGLVATHDGRIVEPLLGLHVDAAEHEEWLVADALDPAGHPIEAAGIPTDGDLRPLARTDGRRPSPTSGSRERSSPASGRYGSDAATGSPSPAAGGRRTSWPRTPRGPRSTASRSP